VDLLQLKRPIYVFDKFAVEPRNTFLAPNLNFVFELFNPKTFELFVEHFSTQKVESWREHLLKLIHVLESLSFESYKKIVNHGVGVAIEFLTFGRLNFCRGNFMSFYQSFTICVERVQKFLTHLCAFKNLTHHF
jgi:hypothetical protein